MIVFLFLFAFLGLAIGAPESDEKFWTLDEALVDVAPEHFEGVKQYFQCIKDNITIDEKYLGNAIRSNLEYDKGIFAFMLGLYDRDTSCFRESDDKYIRAWGNVMDAMARARHELRVLNLEYPYLKGFDISTYVDLLNRTSRINQFDPWFMLCSVYGQRPMRPFALFHRLAVALGIITEELVPGSGIRASHRELPQKLQEYLNPGLFDGSYIFADQVIVGCIDDSDSWASMKITTMKYLSQL
ncbi:unnamed protein product [Bursaphelenchus xylophilus]|uniref:(pine wood nematode) hypothetical protein n=1 Tax=Bursaphelenchus xylophilus TaxID=6326 RepID=A0A1I7S1I5_BURXY|nr:unnamed protein product [Bursaphelenchus xylophilus]CAG9081448.1 unnamed protein product [Bursaphelenchus xylophilus]